jgi:DNA-binding CsgD family transcriptional regulator
LRRRKEKLAARAVLSEAEQIFTSLGAPIWAKQAADELGRLGLHRGTIGELTPTEERIARLVATGMTNKEVAAATFVTVKTVEANLGRIYRKLGIHSRRELATYPPLVGAVTDAKGNRPT